MAKQRKRIVRGDSAPDMRERNIRLLDSDWQALKKHFAHMGLSLASGMRFMVSQYLDEKKLR